MLWSLVAAAGAALAMPALWFLPPSTKTLTAEQVAMFYNGPGGRADELLSRYVERPVVERVSRALKLPEVDDDGLVFEFGCGTGTLAELMLDSLPPTVSYIGTDLSSVRTAAARSRLAPFGPRARVDLVDARGGVHVDVVGEGTVDRFVCVFVLDLLSPYEIAELLGEAHRTLKPGGLLGLASLSTGSGPISRTVAATWNAIHTLNPMLVGGCRPVDTQSLLQQSGFEITWAFDAAGVPLEGVVARKRVGDEERAA